MINQNYLPKNKLNRNLMKNKNNKNFEINNNNS